MIIDHHYATILVMQYYILKTKKNIFPKFCVFCFILLIIVIFCHYSLQQKSLGNHVLCLSKDFHLSQTIVMRNQDIFFHVASNLGINHHIVQPFIFPMIKRHKNQMIKRQVNSSIFYQWGNTTGMEDANKNEVFKKYVFFTMEHNKSTKKMVFLEGYAQRSVYNTILNSGASYYIVNEYIKLFQDKVNFKSDLMGVVKFAVLFNILESKTSYNIDQSEIIYASLATQKKEYILYKFYHCNNKDYFFEDGVSINKTFFMMPIPGAKITSGYGYRIHPISREKKLHRGIDISAKQGTPIQAAASGKIVRKLIDRGYGKYLIIKHNNIYSTLYAHMYNFHPNIVIGRHVIKGDTIGYVGDTGLSTAPHLHYEIRKYNIPINPKKIQISHELAGRELFAFNIEKNNIRKILQKKNHITIASQSLFNSNTTQY